MKSKHPGIGRCSRACSARLGRKRQNQKRARRNDGLDSKHWRDSHYKVRGSSVRILYLTLIAAARKSIFLQSAYFVPDQYTIEQLIAAHKRGVDINIMVPGEFTDSLVVDYASREMWGDLLAAGVKFYRYDPALFHCKVFVVDEFFTSVGSTNFDERSFRLNDEANLNVLDRDVAKRQLLDFQNDRKHATEVTYEDWKNRSISEKLWGKVATLVNSQL